MRFRAYPNYKDSGVEWLGKVPTEWELAPLGYHVMLLSGATPDKSKPEYWDGPIPWVSPKDMKVPRIVDAEDHVSIDALSNSALKLVPVESVLVVVRGMILAHSFPVAQTMAAVTINQDMKAIICMNRLLPRFLAWSLSGYKNVFVSLAGESAHGTRKLETASLTRFAFLFPSIQKQRAIAEFLDRQTNKLDKLISKKRELIDRLKEKRTALISRCVTRGLPPAAARAAGLPENPALKPSGVEWIGEIPAHWTISQVWLERIALNLEYQDGNHGELHPKVENYVDTGIPFVMANHISAGVVDFSSCNYIEPELADSLRIGHARCGDVLLTHKGTVGRVGLVQENSFPCIVLTPQVTYYRFLRGVFNRYIFYFFQGSLWQDQMHLVSSLGTTRAYVGLLEQRSLRLLIPPFSEQTAIADYLDKETAKIDALISKVETAIERLLEYRAALITAAVTGKIDVRECAA